MSNTSNIFGAPPAERLHVDIGDAERDFYRENGYLAVPRVTTDAELEWLRSVYDALLGQPRSGLLDGVFDLAAPYGSLEEPRLGQLLFPEKQVPQIRDTNTWQNARRIASSLLELESDAVESWGHLIFKAPESTAETPWHQDEAYWDVNLEYRALGSWLALDPVDTDNGCLWFVPGSHRSRVFAHRHLGGNSAIHVLELDETVDTRAGVAVPLAAGGMTFHHSRTLHHAGINRTARIRRAWANEFQSEPVIRSKPADHKWLQPGLDAMREAARRAREAQS